ncbi:SRPBCC domain-containing protein [Brevundimonas sp.]|uniref:SRPBCC family protein n=1 Tax=Brevundimonas sp. TaxID=1871086 RepID=UPI0019CC6EFA|nr:SRPBCC domain-containing protein [Brevundimonas sp.]MBD3836358.1 SRPBCC domain-containing protein [Brevundimonas sp.]
MTLAEDLDSRPTLRLRRTFDAPRALVWRAWSRPEILVLWMGPVEWPAFSVTSDFRIGGAWRIGLKSPDTGEALWQGGVYREIVEPERIVFTFKWEGENHEDGPAVDTLVTVQLSETDDGRTEMDFTHDGLKNACSLAGHTHGWTSTADRLEAWLAANPD